MLEENKTTEEIVRETPKKKKTDVMMILSIIAFVIFIPLTISNIWVSIQTYILPDRYPEVFGVSIMPVKTTDFEGLGYKSGDLLIFNNFAANKLAENDTVAFMVKDSDSDAYSVSIKKIGKVNYDADKKIKDFYVYGIEKTEENSSIEIKKDPQNITPDKIEGKVIHSIPWMGNVLNFFSQPIGIIVLLGVPVLIYFLADFSRTSRKNKKNEVQPAEKADES